MKQGNLGESGMRKRRVRREQKEGKRRKGKEKRDGKKKEWR